MTKLFNWRFNVARSTVCTRQRTSAKTLPALTGLLLTALLLMSGCQSESVNVPEVPSRQQSSQGAKHLERIELSASQAKDMHLQLATAKQSHFPLMLALTGEVRAVQEQLTHILTPVGGQVLSVAVQPGDRVQQGQVLCRLKSDQVGQLQADLLQAIIALDADQKQAEVQSRLSRSNYLRESHLVAEKISARVDMETARTVFEKDVATINALRQRRESTIRSYQERLRLLGAPPDAAERVVQSRRINPIIDLRATRNGVVISRTINQGEYADPSKELFQVADLSKVWVVGQVFERDISKIDVGQRVQIFVDSLPGHVFEGRLSFVGALLKPDSRTLDIRVDVPNTSGKLKPNMFARLELITDYVQTVTVPAEAIQTIGDKAFVYKPVPGTQRMQFIEQPVEVLATYNNETAIKQGLQPGESVAAAGTLALRGEMLRK